MLLNEPLASLMTFFKEFFKILSQQSTNVRFILTDSANIIKKKKKYGPKHIHPAMF